MPDVEVAVIGAGPGGIAAGVELKRSGVDDFVILERAAEVGGSWYENTYPGIGVDIPTIAYQYSFARNADWSRFFAPGAEVQDYHVGVARRFGLYEHLRFDADVQREEWDDDLQAWRLQLAGGGELTARFVISAVGAFLNPKQDPGIPGLEEFAGKIQRPSSWDHGYDHRGKRVAVIGTGASSVQITPSIAPEVGSLTVFQRTPVWCLPKPDFAVPGWLRRVLQVPGLQADVHGVVLVGVDAVLRLAVLTPMWLVKPAMRQFDATAKALYSRLLRAVIRDDETRRGLTPDYGPLGKRPTMSNTYLRAFNRENVQLVTEPIERFTRTGVRTADGVEHELDMVVLATGYELFSDPESYPPGMVVGRDGMDLGKFYAEHGLQAYESVAIPRLPNRWMLVGPYSWTGSGWHAFVEMTAHHAVRAIRETRRRGATVAEVRQAAHDTYHAAVNKHRRSIQYYFTELNGHVRTYYRNSQGDVTYIRPSSFFQARRRSRRFPLDDYAYL